MRIAPLGIRGRPWVKASVSEIRKPRSEDDQGRTSKLLTHLIRKTVDEKRHSRRFSNPSRGGGRALPRIYNSGVSLRRMSARFRR